MQSTHLLKTNSRAWDKVNYLALMGWRNNTSAFEMTVPASSVKSSALQGALYCWIKNNNLSAFTLNHALRSNANYATASPRFIIDFLKTLSIICSGQLKKSNSPLNPFSFNFLIQVSKNCFVDIGSICWKTNKRHREALLFLKF